jgi:hypothetical protein
MEAPCTVILVKQTLPFEQLGKASEPTAPPRGAQLS